MNVSFQIQYNCDDVGGTSVETTSCVALTDTGRAHLHALLDEFLDNGFGKHAPKSDDDEVMARFIVYGKPCDTHG